MTAEDLRHFGAIGRTDGELLRFLVAELVEIGALRLGDAWRLPGAASPRRKLYR